MAQVSNITTPVVEASTKFMVANLVVEATAEAIMGYGKNYSGLALLIFSLN